MSGQTGPTEKPHDERTASSIWDAIKVDFNTVRTILVTACVVLVLLSIPLTFVLRNFVTFDALDKYFRVTESVRPKILTTISEELGSGYSKNFLFDAVSTASRTADNSMLFYAAKDRRVTLSVSAIPVAGAFQSPTLQLNGCNIPYASSEELHLYNFDLTKKLDECPPAEPSLHTLRIAFPRPLVPGTTIQVRCFILVYERVREHI